MRRSALALTLLGTFLLAEANCPAQPLLDRVLDRVENELDNRTKPIPLEEPAPEDAVPQPRDDEPGYLGVIADDRKEQGRGVRVLEVVEGGPADLGGLRANDLITTINLKPVRNMDDMAKILTRVRAGQDVEFSVRRDTDTESITVTLGVRPAPAERRLENFGRQPEVIDEDVPPGERPRLGVRTLPVSAQTAAQFRLPNRDGAIVVAVTPGSPAERGGIRVGTVITTIDGRPVRNPDHLAELVATANPRGTMAVTAVQDGRPLRLTVAFGNEPPAAVEEPPVARPPATASPAGEPLLEEQPAPTPRLEEEPLENASELDALERRLQELEDRIEKLEAALENKT